MANETLVSVLRHGAVQWNAWRERDATFDTANLQEAFLKHADMRCSNLSCSMFSHKGPRREEGEGHEEKKG